MELTKIQSSLYTDPESAMSISELARIVATNLGWMVSSDGTICELDENPIGKIQHIGQVMLALGWITYNEGRDDYLYSGYTAVNWNNISSMENDNLPGKEQADQIRYIIEISGDVGIKTAVIIRGYEVPIEVIREIIQSGLDTEILNNLLDAKY